MGREREEKEARGESEEVKPVVGHGRPHRPLPLTLHVAGGGGGGCCMGAWKGLSRAVI